MNTPTLQKYEILDKIAEGSMATVYKGRRRDDSALVAVKIPKPKVAGDPVLLERFQKEYRAGCSLSHPNIVLALDCGQEGATPFLVMEYMAGSDLWHRIDQQGRLPEREAVDIIVQVARGLQEAHKHGIIHRDVKPENILFDGGGRPKLADLGLIKDLEDQEELTRTRTGLGTPSYMAPEQFRDAKRAGPSCDVYSLAATLYKAVTGEVPFRAKALAGCMRMKINNELVPPRKLVPELSERVDWAIRRALQADPKRRPASCLEFIQALTGEDAPASPAANRASRPGPNSPLARGERRRTVRHRCDLPTRCEVFVSIHDDQPDAQESWDVRVQDISVSGIKFKIKRRFEPGTLMTLKLQSPDQRFRRSVAMEVVHAVAGRQSHWLIGGTFKVPLGKDDVRKLL